MKIAAAQYPVSFQTSWADYEIKLEHWVGDAASSGADILVFPEYAPMELASLFSLEVQQDVRLQLPALQDLLEDYLALHSRLALEHGVYIVAGSYPVRVAERNDDPSPFSVYVNRAYFFGPGGTFDFQDKLIMTRFERETWGISSGAGLKVFETPHGRLGILICYDCEFPHLSRKLVEAGADLILIPSCTDTLNGYHRVEVGGRARALENQCFTVQAPLVGTSDWCETIDVCLGAAGFYTPIDAGYPENGVLARGELNIPGWVYADLDLSVLKNTRANGQVLNYQHWTEGEVQALGPLERVQL